MSNHECPRCGSPKATSIMLPPARGSQDARPHPAFRCMACDTQWSDEEEWARIHADQGAAQGADQGADQGDGPAAGRVPETD